MRSWAILLTLVDVRTQRTSKYVNLNFAMDSIKSFNNICTPKTEDFSAELRQMIYDKNIFTVRTRHKLLSDLDDMSQKAKEEKRETMRGRALEEIFTSEVTYLQQLDKVIKYFMIPMKSLNFLSPNDFNTIFGNIETIYNVNGELLVELKKNFENAPFAFLKLAPFFKLYSFYAYDYKKAITILHNLENNNPDFKEFLKNQESCDAVSMKLPALLITPIQRIPRYRLLLKQVIDHTLPHHRNYQKLLEALKEVESTADHINSLVEEHENIERMLELQRSLQNNYPCIIKPGRRLIKEGTLTKMSSKRTRGYSRHFVLMSDIIMYCKVVSNNPKVLQCCCILPLNKCKIEKLKNKSFKLSCQDESFILYSESALNLESWVKTLKNAIIEYIDCRKTLRKDSSRRQPIRKKYDLDFDYLGLSPSILKHKRKFQDYEDIFYVQSDENKENKSNWFNFGKKRSLSPESNSVSGTPVKKVRLVDDNSHQETPLTSNILNRPQTEEKSSKLYNMISRIKNSFTNLFSFK